MNLEYEYEIYTKHPITGECGWDIRFVTVVAGSEKRANELVRTYPTFDCIITSPDFVYDGAETEENECVYILDVDK